MILCGIDEAGRGPLAGPLCFAGCILTGEVKGLNDSKKLTEAKRDALFDEVVQNSIYHIVWHSAKEIDELGISACIKRSLIEIKSVISADRYLFDGNSRFGVNGLETMVKADAQVTEVMAASILAKVSRDRFMIKMDIKYPQYGFAKHKGYGTAAHIEAIRVYGLSEIHRESYKPKSLQPSLF
ncbi:MAG: ribonuclease HII [Campylobacteraceae bacterium]|jgi:ribonuclease HII|nr:ribonuclease HII [Campylobacteraceae bacterium]